MKNKIGNMTLKILPNLLACAVLAVVPLTQPDIAFSQPKGCPPGLAKKNPPCVPPGLAKKGVSPNQWQNKDRIGVTRDRDDFIFLDNYARYHLPRLSDDQRYAVFDNQIVVIDRKSYEILKLIQAFTAITD